jgi:hypothetical protein
VSFSKYLVWSFFIIACVQQAFLFPDISLIPGERANLFSGLLCFVAFISALAILKIRGNGVRVSEVVISVTLASLAFASSALSATPGVSFARSFVIISSMLGGYWTSRLLLNNIESRLFIQKFCLVLLFCIIFLTFAGILTGGNVYRFIDSGAHQVVSRILILSFAPISFLFGTSFSVFLTGVVTLVVTYCCLVALDYYGTVRTGLVIPFGLSLLAIFFVKKTRKILIPFFAILLIGLLGASTLFFWHSQKNAKESQSVAYRIENIYFSTYLAMKHPLLGIGPSSPRAGFVNDYDIKYPFLTKDTFREWSDNVRTSENTIFTLLADLGFPFVILYLSALFCLVWRLARLAWRPPLHYTPAPLALLLAIIGSFVHFQVFDGPYLPQISWFFHILLGMVLFSPNDLK